MEMNTVQIKGVDSTKRVSKAELKDGAKLVITEKIMTHGDQTAETSFDVIMSGKDSSCHLVSRSVARDNSKQVFRSYMRGDTECYGHSECDGIIMDNGVVSAIPEIIANDVDARLIHEAAIGKIAGEQLIKLMTLGQMCLRDRITAAQATICVMPSMLMGTLVGHYARIVLVTEANKKYTLLMFLIPLFDAAPVSYTHLDVYKRQRHWKPPAMTSVPSGSASAAMRRAATSTIRRLHSSAAGAKAAVPASIWKQRRWTTACA